MVVFEGISCTVQRLWRYLHTKPAQPVRYIVLLYSLMFLFTLAAQQGSGGKQCPVVKVEAERLADLNVPRYGHTVLLLNGEPTVIGGHTTNFVPTPTLEYYKDGKWHLVQTAFTHDDGCAVELSTGKVLIMGGHKENMGIGQSFEVELYDPSTRTSEGFASLDTKRAMLSALALDDGRAVIAGNWHHKDAIEIYDGKVSFLPVKDVSIGRGTPFILQTAKDNAIIIGGMDTVGNQITLPVADRLQGEPCHVPLLEQWRIPSVVLMYPSSTAFIGDKPKGDYSYLLLVTNDEGQLAIARVTNGEFTLLPTDVPIPTRSSQGEEIYYKGIFVDRQCQRAYLVGDDSRHEAINPSVTTRVYVVAIDYAMMPARLTFYYTDVLTDTDIDNLLLTADGDLMLVGGVPQGSYFKPTATTWLIHISPRSQTAATGWPLWKWALLVLTIAAVAAMLALLFRRRKKEQTDEMPPIGLPDAETLAVPVVENLEATDEGENCAELMRRLCQMMEEQRPYLNPDLKVSDVANALGTTRIVLSNCIKSQQGCTFPQFVNTYRVTLAQQLLSKQPDSKIAEVWMTSGFASESSFYRIFKSITGVTPNEWKSNSSA